MQRLDVADMKVGETRELVRGLIFILENAPTELSVNVAIATCYVMRDMLGDAQRSLAPSPPAIGPAGEGTLQ